MIYLFRALVLSLALALGAAHAAVDVAGVSFEEQTTVAGEEVALNGAGVRTRVVFKVYAMGLYLPRRAENPEAILEMPGAKRIRIVTLRDLGANQFVDALVEGLEKNHDAATLDTLRPSIDAFRGAILGVEQTPKGTEVLIEWIPGAGTRLTVAGKRQGYDIADEAFYAALLRVWLGERPADADLKRNLLGSKQ